MLLDVFTPSPSPLGPQWVSALVASLPIVAMLTTLGLLRWRAHAAAPFAWGVAVFVAVIAFGMPPLMALSTSLHGVAYAIFPLLWILLAAIWMYQVGVASGRFEDLRRTLFLISDDRRVLGVLIAFSFGGLLESLGGFGAPVAIVASMLLAVGCPPVKAGLLALLANTAPVAFGGFGLPVIIAATTGGFDDVLAVAPITGRLTAILSLVVPFLLLVVIDGRRGVRDCWPIGLVVGGTFFVVKWVVSGSSLYNLTEVLAAVSSVGTTLLLLRFWRPPATEPIRAPEDPTLTRSRIAMALLPYGLVIVVFGVAALPPIRAALAATDVALLWPGLGGLLDPSGQPAGHQTYTLAWASTPGLLLSLVALATGLIYRMPPGQILRVLWDAAKRLRFAILTIAAVVALAYVMGDSGQTLALGLFIGGAGAAYPFLAPTLGWVGTYVTGSDTSSNILFSSLQSGVGAEIGPDSAIGTDSMRALLVGSAGGVVGKMISPQSLSIAATAIAVPGSEATLFRKALGWSLLLLALLCILVGLTSTGVLDLILP